MEREQEREREREPHCNSDVDIALLQMASSGIPQSQQHAVQHAAMIIRLHIYCYKTASCLNEVAPHMCKPMFDICQGNKSCLRAQAPFFGFRLPSS